MPGTVDFDVESIGTTTFESSLRIVPNETQEERPVPAAFRELFDKPEGGPDFDNVLGRLKVTKWKPYDFLSPPGLTLNLSGGIEPDVAEAVNDAGDMWPGSPRHPPRLHVSVSKMLDSDLIDGANNFLVAYDGSIASRA